MYQDVKEVLIKKEEIHQMVASMAMKISKEYQGRDLVLIAVMKGSLIFTSDLMRHLTIPMAFGTITVSSYGSGTVSKGEVKIVHDADVDVKDKDVIIVEDLIDTGRTLRYLKDFLELRGPRSVKICVAFDKPSRRQTEVEVEYIGLEIPDVFVVGYGLDYNEKYRNLPELCSLKEELYR